ETSSSIDLVLPVISLAVNDYLSLHSNSRILNVTGSLIRDRSSAHLRRQVPQLVRIADHVQCANDVSLNLEGCSLYCPLRSVHDETRKAVNRRKAQCEVLAPPFGRDANQEPRHAIGTLEHFRSCRPLAAAIRHNAHVARQQLRQPIEIARASRRHECRHELSMLGID